MKKAIIITALIAAPLLGQGAATRGAFSYIGVDARAMGMGGAFAALAQGASAAYWNPAALSDIRGYDFRGMYLRYTDLPLDCGYASIAQEDKGYGAGAISWEYTGVKAYDKTVKWGENCISYAFAKELSAGISLGGRLKFLFTKSDIEGADVTGGAADFGFLSKLGSARIGVVIRDLVSYLKWETGTKEMLPISYQIGACYTFFDGIISAELDLTGEKGLPLADVRFGVEGWPVANFLALRAGIIHKMGEWDRRNIYSAGFGVKMVQGVTTYFIDYAFVTDKEVFGPSHRLSIGVSW